jgi:hypothetical protein
MKKNQLSLSSLQKIKTEKELIHTLQKDSYFSVPYYSNYNKNGDYFTYIQHGIAIYPYGNVEMEGKELLSDGVRMMNVDDMEKVEESIEWMKRNIKESQKILNDEKTSNNPKLKKSEWKKIAQESQITDEELSCYLYECQKLILYYPSEIGQGSVYMLLKEGIYVVDFQEVWIEKGWEKYLTSTFRPLDEKEKKQIEKTIEYYQDLIEKCEFVLQRQSMRKLLTPET